MISEILVTAQRFLGFSNKNSSLDDIQICPIGEYFKELTAINLF